MHISWNHGGMIWLPYKGFYPNFPIILANINRGTVIKTVEFIYIFINHCVLQWSEILALILIILNLLLIKSYQKKKSNTLLNDIFSKIKTSNKLFHIAGNFNLNLLDNNTNRKVQRFFIFVCINGITPRKNKSSRVAQKTTTEIDHILTNSFTDSL